MASILATGAGASEGLDRYLLNMIREAQSEEEQKRTAEVCRHNVSEEGLRGRELNINEGLRKESQRQNQINSDRLYEDRKNQERNRIRDDTRRNLEDIMGTDVMITPETKDAAVRSGAAVSERFKPVVPYTDDFVGPIPETGPARGEAKGYTVPDHRRPTGGGGYNTEQKTYILNGKPVDAIFDPRTKRITAMSGEDITEKVGHYEKPDQTLVQTGGGYDTRTHVRDLLGKGEEVPLADPAQVRGRQDLAERVGSHFDDIQQMLDDAEQKGLLGPLKGRTYNEFMAGKVGSTGNPENDDLLGELRQNLSLARSGLAQLHGRGGANVGIVQGLEKNMDAGYMDYNMLTGALRGMKNWVNTYATKKGKGGAKPAAASGSGNDLYDEYLKRHAGPQD